MFRLSSTDNGLYFFRDRRDVARCGGCHSLTSKRSEDLASVSIARELPFDLSTSYDGVLVASKHFVSAASDVDSSALELRNLQKGLLAIRPTVVVAFDSKKRGTRFERQCAACGQYESVIGATPVQLVEGSVVPEDGFARTDVEFGSGDEKTPIVLCGARMAERLSREKLRGLELVPAQ